MPIEFEPDNNQFEEPDNALTDALFYKEDDAPDALWDLLSAYTDGEATPEEASRVEAMLSADPAYARRLQFLRLTAESARDFIEIEPPATLRESIFAATSHRPSLARRVATRWDELRRAALPGFTRYVLPTGALAAAAVAAFVLWPRPHDAQVGPKNSLLALNTPNPNFAPMLTKPTNTLPEVKPEIKPTQNSLKTAPSRSVSTPATVNEKRVTPGKARHEETEKTTHSLLAFNDSPRHNESAETHPKINLADLKPTPNKPVVAPSVKKPASSPSAEKPKTTEDEASRLVAFNEPNMDAKNEHFARTMINAELDDVPASARAAETDTATAPVAPAASSSTKRIIVGHLLRDQLPPDPRQIVTGGYMKQLASAKNQRYNDETVRAIQRRELGVSLISSKF